MPHNTVKGMEWLCVLYSDSTVTQYSPRVGSIQHPPVHQWKQNCYNRHTTLLKPANMSSHNPWGNPKGIQYIADVSVPPYHWTAHQHCLSRKTSLWTLWQKNDVCHYVNRKIEILWIRESPAPLELLRCSRNQWVWWFLTWSLFQVYSLWCICREQCR